MSEITERELTILYSKLERLSRVAHDAISIIAELGHSDLAHTLGNRYQLVVGHRDRL